MCDVQILTGLVILIISAYADLSNSISAYHFFLVINLAWFLNLSYVCGLLALRRYLSSRPAEKLFRLACMAILAAMLLVAIAPTLFSNWGNADQGTASMPGADAICFYNISRSID